MPRRAVLVTGAPRSGTTFAGRMLALPGSVAYLDEPYNLQMGAAGVPHQFWRGAAEGPDPVLDAFTRRLLSGRATLKQSPWHAGLSPAARLGRRVLVSRAHVRYRAAALDPRVRTWLVKDPMAAFVAERLHRRHAVAVVVVVRHPVAVAASCLRLGWDFEALPRVLAEARAAGEDVGDADAGSDHLTHLGLLWRAVYGHLAAVADRCPDVRVVRHEDLSRSPVETLRSLYDGLGLPFTAGIEAQVRAHTASANPDRVEQAHVLHRDSRALADRAAQALPVDQRAVLRAVVAPVADRFYSDSDWPA